MAVVATGAGLTPFTRRTRLLRHAGQPHRLREGGLRLPKVEGRRAQLNFLVYVD
jgi:hypothetical protein